MKFTKNLAREEMQCKCGCGYSTADYELVTELQNVVNHFQHKYAGADIRIHINSGTRCAKHNQEIGGSPKSRHVSGQAADFYLYDKTSGNRIDSYEVYDYLIRHFPDSKGIGKYPDRTHFDVRKTVARW